MAHDPPEHREHRKREDPDFAEGQDDPEVYPDEERGRFSEGEEALPEADPEKHRQGRFSEGTEQLPESDPEKHVKRRFSEGEEELPPDTRP
jgi:hypothetical protein